MTTLLKLTARLVPEVAPDCRDVVWKTAYATAFVATLGNRVKHGCEGVEVAEVTAYAQYVADLAYHGLRKADRLQDG